MGIKLISLSHFLTLVFLESLEKRGEESLEKRGLRKDWRSEGGGARSSEEGLPSTRAKEVSTSPKLPHFSIIFVCILSPPSPTFSHSFKMVFFWLLCIIPLFVFMMVGGVGIEGKKNKRIVVPI